MAKKKTTTKKRGRKSAYLEKVDAQWLQDVLTGKTKIQDVVATQSVIKRKRITIDPETKQRQVEIVDEIVDHFKNGRHALAYHVFTGNEKMLSKILDKLVASKSDITTEGDKLPTGGFIVMPAKETE